MSNAPEPPEAPIKIFELRLPLELHRRLVSIARQHNRSLHGEILTALEQYAEAAPQLAQPNTFTYAMRTGRPSKRA